MDKCVGNVPGLISMKFAYFIETPFRLPSLSLIESQPEKVVVVVAVVMVVASVVGLLLLLFFFFFLLLLLVTET